MRLRSLRERIIQVIAFEVGAFLLAVPLYALIFEESAASSALLLTVLTAAVMVWSPIHNTLFDWVDGRLSGRLASDRLHRWRIVHAVSHEATTMFFTLPLILGMTGLGLKEALALDVGLTLFYAAYAYIFHLVFDMVRPMTPRMPPPTFCTAPGS